LPSTAPISTFDREVRTLDKIVATHTRSAIDGD
jgi:hypothetical protein